MTDGADGRPTGRPGPKRVGQSNLRDVARRAGVSPATASRALGDADGVSPVARERVFRAAAELNYVVNGLARSMMGRGARTIAFVVREMVGPTFAEMAASVEQVATPAGHLFVVSTTHGDPEIEGRFIRTMREQRASAVMLVGTAPSPHDQVEAPTQYHEELRAVGARLMLCGRPPVPGLPEIPSIDYDHEGGIAAAVDHLAKLGHRRIGYLGRTVGTTPERRVHGYRRGLHAAGIRYDRRLVVETQNAADSGRTAATALFDAGVSHPTAVVCETDNVAVGVYRALGDRGMSVPHDVSVVGFDDLPLVSDLSPGLTTVRAPFAEVGTRAGRIAVGLETYERAIVLDTALIVRGSTAKP